MSSVLRPLTAFASTGRMGIPSVRPNHRAARPSVRPLHPRRARRSQRV